jgi:hypothetical protein
LWHTHTMQSDEPDTVVIVSQVCGSTRRFDAGSTSNLKCLKKSTQMMGNETAARRKVHWNRLPLKDSVRVVSPQLGMIFPAGPNRVGPKGALAE